MPSRPSQKQRKLPGVFRHWPAQTSVWHSSTSERRRRRRRRRIQKRITELASHRGRSKHKKNIHERAHEMRFPRTQIREGKQHLRQVWFFLKQQFGTLPTPRASLKGHEGTSVCVRKMRLWLKVCIPPQSKTLHW